ncbi:MAG: tetratricopeptide repeat protein [Desulfuromonadaceae bacterium]|nr:tetratricopeptide repeat protein [Desulfuromonadaceae bacterium]
MILLKLCRNTLIRFLVALVIISFLSAPCAFSQESEDSQIFIAGFNAFQQKDYTTSIEKMNEVLQKFPDTPLRDVSLFWLSRSYYKAGNHQEAARYLSQFSKEYPENPLKTTVEDELLALVTRYEKGETLPTGSPSDKRPDILAARKAQRDKDQIAAKAEETKQATDAARTAAFNRMKEKAAAVKREQDRIARETAAQESTEQQRIAAVKADEALRAEVAAEATRIEAQKAESLRRAQQEKLERGAQAEAELARMNALNAEKEHTAAAERVARKRAAEITAEEARLAEQKRADETAMAKKLAYREKAISQYKSIIDKFPASSAAAVAAGKLRELGIAVAFPVQTAASPLPENAQVFRLEVAQFAGFEFNLLPYPEAFTVGQQQAVPFEITNRGNGADSFHLESAFPADFRARFATVAVPGVAITQTPLLAPNETFKGVLSLTVPPDSIDGLRSTYPVKAASQLMTEASQSREVRLIASAPLLRAVVRTEKNRPVPGDKIVYRIAVLNVGSTAAKDVAVRLNFPPQFEPVDYAAAGFRQETGSALLVDGLQIKSGENRELSVAFQLKDDSLAGQELSTRVELINNQLKTAAVFVSNLSSVAPQRSLLVHAGSARIVAIPGQTVTAPFVVTNTGNVREKFKVSSMITGAGDAVVFNDLNRDGIRQASEPLANEVGPLAPREEASIAVEIKTPPSAADGSSGSVRLSFISEGDATRSASDSTQLTYSRPVLKMAMAGKDGRLKPGDVASFDLTITNSGSNLAKVVELQSAWPEQLELIAADPATSAVNNGTVIWRFIELGAAEKRNIKVSFRVKPGTGVGTAIQVRSTLNYEDQLGNRY